jgi:hypothetical protein
VAVVMLVGVCAFLARDRVAASLARQWLRDHGVASDVVVRGLSARTASGEIRLGDPADPDLTVDRLEIDYALQGPWSGEAFGLRMRGVRLIRPRLKARLVDGRLRLGALDGLIRTLQRAPATGEAPPDIKVEDGVVLLAMDGGLARLRGAGEMRGGRLVTLDARLDPFRQTVGSQTWRGAGGVVHAVGLGRRLIARLDFGPTSVSTPNGEISGAAGVISANIPYLLAAERWSGPVSLSITAAALSGRGREVRADGGDIDASIEGVMEADALGQTLNGPLRVSSHLASIGAPTGSLKAASVTVAFTSFAMKRGRDGVSITGQGNATFSAARLGGSTGALSELGGAVKFDQLMFQSPRDGGVRVAAALNARLAARGGFTAKSARRIVLSTPGLSPEYAASLERALVAFRFAAPAARVDIGGHDVHLTLGAPVRVETDSGARVTLGGNVTASAGGTSRIQGAADLALSGGGLPVLTVAVRHADIASDQATADMSGQGVFDLSIAKDAHVEAGGHLLVAASRVRFDLSNCANVTMRRLDLDPYPITGLAARVCPGDGPLIEAGQAGWRARGRLEAAAGAMPGLFLDLRDGDGTFDAGRREGRDTAGISLAHARLNDTADDLRFRAMDGAGRITLADGVWSGSLAVASQAGRPVGQVRVRHDLATGEGRADIDAASLAFKPGALQPGDLTPLASFARDADGLAGFTGWIAWRPGVPLSSGGDLSLKALTLKSPLGPLDSINGNIRFTSLAPPVTAREQSIVVGKVETVIPLTDVAAVFDMDAAEVRLHAASATIARGHVSLEPMTASLAPGGVLSGALVLDRVNLGDIIAATNLADSVRIDALLNGRLPFQVRDSHLSITGGDLRAAGPGRISISRALLGGLGAATPAAPASQANFAQDLAYQAMDNLAFDQLDVAVNSQAKDRLGMLFHIRGRHDPPQRQRAVITVADLIAGRALSKPMTLPSDTGIDVTLDSSLNFGELVQALDAAWRDALASGEAARHSGRVQGSASIPTTAQGPKPP